MVFLDFLPPSETLATVDLGSSGSRIVNSNLFTLRIRMRLKYGGLVGAALLAVVCVPAAAQEWDRG